MKKLILMVLAVVYCLSSTAQNIVQGEYFFDSKKEYGQGTAVTISAPDDNIAVNMDIPVTNLPQGFHRLFVRFKDSNNRWSQTGSFPVYIKHSEMITLLSGEYFFDSAGEYGTGTPLDLSAQSTMAEVMQSLPVANLPEGLHRLFIRFKDSNHHWSQTLNFSVYVKRQELLVIEEGEYFFDTMVPFGEGFTMNMDSLAAVTTVDDLITVPASLPAGEHLMFYRFRDSNGLWTQTFSEIVCVNILDGTYSTNQTSYCLGDTAFFNYSGTINSSNTYSWDLDQNGQFDDLQTHGEDFFVVLENVQNDSAIFHYKINSTSCNGSFEKQNTLTAGIHPTVSLNAMVTNSDCNNACNGQINVAVNGNTGPYDYLWSNGSLSEDLTDLCSGIYSVTVTNNFGCTVSGSYNVSENSAATIETVSLTNVTCHDLCDGMIDISVTGGLSPFEFEWSNNNTDEDQMDLCEGAYQVTVTDASNCSVIENFTITQPLELSIIAESVTDLNCNGVCEGEIAIDVEGGTSPYMFDWSNGSQEEDQNELCAGEYTVSITDLNGCSDVDTYLLTEPNMINVAVEVTHETEGQANGGIDITVAGGVAPYSFNWSNGSTEENPNSLSAGIYDLTLTDFNGCIFILNGVIIDNIVSTSRINAEESVNIFPNPTNDFVQIQFDLITNKHIELSLSDELGVKVLQQFYDGILNDRLNLSLAFLPKGIYFIQLKSQDFLIVQKIVLQ